MGLHALLWYCFCFSQTLYELPGLGPGVSGIWMLCCLSLCLTHLHQLTPNHVAEIQNRIGSNRASISLITRVQGQVAHMKFVKNKNNTTATHGDPCELPTLKIKYNLDPEGYRVSRNILPCPRERWKQW